MAPQRLQPGMTVGNDTALFGDLALERVGLGTGRGERRVVIPDEGARHSELPLGVIRKNRHETRLVAPFRYSEQRRHPPAAAHGFRHGFPEALHRLHGDRSPRNRAPVAKAWFP